MDRATFNELVGGIVGNLLSLEFLMRFLLVQTESPIEPMPVFDELKAGDHVAEGTFTNYESLGDVIARTNAYLEAHGIGERVDPSIVGLSRYSPPLKEWAVQCDGSGGWSGVLSGSTAQPGRGEGYRLRTPAAREVGALDALCKRWVPCSGCPHAYLG
jgi:hypothetical protein